MPVSPHSVIVGKRFSRGPSEIRTVKMIQKNQVKFESAMSTDGGGQSRSIMELPLERFAREADGEV
jgi:hypothetical protein